MIHGYAHHIPDSQVIFQVLLKKIFITFIDQRDKIFLYINIDIETYNMTQVNLKQYI
jgi:hypothetical protein